MRWPWSKPQPDHAEIAAALARADEIDRQTESSREFRATVVSQQRETARELRTRAEIAMERNHFGESLQKAMERRR